MSTPPLLEARRILRDSQRDQRRLLDHVTLAVDVGDRLAVTGAAGSGKSLLLRSLAYLDPIGEGEVRWQGTRVGDLGVIAFRRRVLYLHQRPAMFDGTVEDNLRRPYSLHVRHDQRFDRERIVALLDTFSRDVSFLKQPVEELSGGEVQLVALLRAVQLDAQVLLLDEPTSSLDAATTGAAERVIDDWFGEQPDRAFIWVTHGAEQAARVAGRTVVMRAGRLQEGART